MRLAALSVDLDEIGCYAAIHGLEAPGRSGRAIYDKALPRLRALFASEGVPCTFFAIGRDLDRDNGARLRMLAEEGHEIANHSLDHLYDLTDELGAIVREVDASLIDEWERLGNPEKLEQQIEGEVDEGPVDVTANRHGFTAMVRNTMARLVRAFALRRWDEAAELLEGAESPWKPEQLEEALEPFFEEHRELRFDPAARSPKHTLIEEAEGVWRVRQVLVDPDEHLDWSIAADIDLARAREEGRPVLELRSVGPS